MKNDNTKEVPYSINLTTYQDIDCDSTTPDEHLSKEGFMVAVKKGKKEGILDYQESIDTVLLNFRDGTTFYLAIKENGVTTADLRGWNKDTSRAYFLTQEGKEVIDPGFARELSDIVYRGIEKDKEYEKPSDVY